MTIAQDAYAELSDDQIEDIGKELFGLLMDPLKGDIASLGMATSSTPKTFQGSMGPDQTLPAPQRTAQRPAPPREIRRPFASQMPQTQQTMPSRPGLPPRQMPMQQPRIPAGQAPAVKQLLQQRMGGMRGQMGQMGQMGQRMPPPMMQRQPPMMRQPPMARQPPIYQPLNQPMQAPAGPYMAMNPYQGY